MAHTATLPYPREEYPAMMFPDAPDEYRGSFLMQVRQAEFDNGMAVGDMSHKALGGLSCVFRNSQLRKPTVDKEGFAFLARFAGWSIFCGMTCTFLRVIGISRIFSILRSAYRRYRTQRRKYWKDRRQF